MPETVNPQASVALISHNMAQGLKECLQALLTQTVRDFEIVLVDDRSTDETRQIVESFRDSRIRYFYNSRRLGYGGTRNLCLGHVRGKYVFFTDADCLPAQDWLARGLSYYEGRPEAIGLVGKTLPAGDSIQRSRRKVQNLDGRFMTCNMSFRKDILDQIGGFDPAFDVGQEDVEMGLRAKRLGPILFAEDMGVVHRLEPYTLRRLFTDARRYKTQVMIFKRYPQDEYHRKYSPPRTRGIFLKTEDWWTIFCPFLLFRSSANQTWKDYALIPFIYFSVLYRRWIIWKTAVRERILLI